MNLSSFLEILTTVASALVLGLSVFLLLRYNRLFAGIRYIWVRRNLAVLAITSAFMGSLMIYSYGMMIGMGEKSMLLAAAKQFLHMTVIVLFVFNLVFWVGRVPRVKRLSFIGYHAVIMGTIIVGAMVIYSIVHYVNNGKNLKTTLTFGFYNACAAGLVYTAVNYVELDRKRKLNEKELEVARLNALKNKAELDALHSKVNPHFLYNALNSIADLAITDGRKARKMTIALADLFRYSINYSQNNYSTVNDEVDMTEVYLQIEKIRFEDQLNYRVLIDEDVRHYLLPRFILQPLAENAVKHGLKATGQMTEILLEVKKSEKGLSVYISDNGPAFPDELLPGYGVKSVFDKLDLLFPDQYDILFSNEPRKQVVIHLYKLMKNEPAL